jgi:hypothetical protein
MTKRSTGWRRRTQDKLPKGSESFAASQLSVIARKLNGPWSRPVGVVHYVQSFLFRAGSTFVGPVLSPGLPFYAVRVERDKAATGRLGRHWRNCFVRDSGTQRGTLEGAADGLDRHDLLCV